MATLTINYSSLDSVAKYASNVAQKAGDYADNLSNKISRKMSDISGGSSINTREANYFVSEKIKKLRTKNTSYNNFSKQVRSFAENAKRIDLEVARRIAKNQEKFLQKHENLRISGWKAKLINWLIDLENNCPIFRIISQAMDKFTTAISNMLENIRYWYKCQGGKQIISFIWAIGGAIVGVLLFVASLPASGFFAICAAIGLAIAAVNGIVNIFTSYRAMRSKDPAWAEIYGKQDKLSDVLRDTNFKNGFWNRITYGAATLIDMGELFCDAVNILKMIGNIKSKFSFIQNFFDKKMGLLSYMKEAKWTDEKLYDEAGNFIKKIKVIKTNEYGVVETRYTVRSILRGTKAYVMDSPIDAHSSTGIRTLLKNNFVTDFKDWKRSVFSITEWKSAIRYRITDGGRISVSEWKKTFSISGLKETIRYNLKNNSFKGIFADGVKWKDRKDYISSSGKTINSVINISTKIKDIITGDYSISAEIKNYLDTKKTNMSDLTKIINKIDKLKDKMETVKKNSYQYKSTHATL